MRLHPTKFFTVLFAAILLSLSCKKAGVTPDCSDYPLPADIYTYPIKPGMPEWANVKPEDRLATVQIKSDVTKLSTEALIQSWLDFPLNHEVLAPRTGVQTGINFYIQNFNGLAELTKKNDAGTILLKRYQSVQPSCITTKATDVAKGNFSFDIFFLELLLAQDTFIEKLNVPEKKLLAATVLKIYDEKIKAMPEYGMFDIGSTLYPGIKVLLQSNYAPFVSETNNRNSVFYAQYLSTGMIPTNDVNSSDIKIMLNHLKQFSR